MTDEAVEVEPENTLDLLNEAEQAINIDKQELKNRIKTHLESLDYYPEVKEEFDDSVNPESSEFSEPKGDTPGFDFGNND